MLKIEIGKLSNRSSTFRYGWYADAKNLSGSPPVGFGKTKEEAIGDLIIRLSQSKDWYKFTGGISITEVD